jgi:hypothetical protein
VNRYARISIPVTFVDGEGVSYVVLGVALSVVVGVTVLVVFGYPVSVTVVASSSGPPLEQPVSSVVAPTARRKLRRRIWRCNPISKKSPSAYADD